MAETRGTMTSNNARPILERISQEKKDLRFSDVTVIVEDVEFSCHRLVLAATSDFFSTLFDSGMREAFEGKVTLHGMSPQIFSLIQQWMYEGELSFTDDNIHDIIGATDQLQIVPLFQECRDFMLENLSENNCISYYQTSLIYPWVKLSETAWTVLLENFDDVSSAAISRLSYEDMKKLMASPWLVTKSEDFVLQKMLRWTKHENGTDACGRIAVTTAAVEDEFKSIAGTAFAISEKGIPSDCTCKRYDDKFCTLLNRELTEKKTESLNQSYYETTKPSTRTGYLVSLISSCRYLLVSNNFLWHSLMNDQLIKSQMECRNLMEATLRYKTQPDTHQHECLMAATHRESSPQKDVLLTVMGGKLVSMPVGGPYTQWHIIEIVAPNRKVVVSHVGYYNNAIYVQVSFPYFETAVPATGDTIAIKETSECLRTSGSMSFIDEPDQISPAYIIGSFSLEDFFPVGERLVGLIKTKVCDMYVINERNTTLSEPNTWNTLGCLSTNGMDIVCTTNIGSKLVVLWQKQDMNNSFTIECFDLDYEKTNTSSVGLNSSSGAVTFKHGDTSFVLEGDGTLWRMQIIPDTLEVTLHQEFRLWSNQLDLSGAIIAAGELLVFEKRPGLSQSSTVLESESLDGVFERVRLCPGSEKRSRYVHAVVRKKLV